LNYRASPKKESKSVSSSASTSFDDFQESVSDAWEIEAEDEILRISGKKLMISNFNTVLSWFDENVNNIHFCLYIINLIDFDNSTIENIFIGTKVKCLENVFKNEIEFSCCF